MKNIFHKRCLGIGAFLLLVVFPLVSSAQVNGRNSDLDSLHQQFLNAVDQSKNEFEEYTRKSLAEYEAYEKQARADYFRYVQAVQRVWGEDSICDDTQHRWVEYGDDYMSRSIVDFSTGNILVELAVDDKESDEPMFVNDRLEKAVKRLLNSHGSTSSFPSSVDVSAPLTVNPVLENLVDVSAYGLDSVTVSAVPSRQSSSNLPQPVVKGKKLAKSSGARERNDDKKETVKKESLPERRTKVKPILKEEVESWSQKTDWIARKAVAFSKKIKRKIKGTDGKERQVVQVEMSLVSDNLSRNAALYKDLVAEFSSRFQIEQSLIYAIMEQESYFNPEATSWVPAYGLMQIVPKSGGRDAYQYVYHKDWIPTRSYLYNPRNNIELGTAYLRVLMNQFASVADSHCRRLCVIAGYNTGAGNVSRSFIGTTNLGKAFSYINQYDYNRLFNHLITQLPYEETRNYVVRVTQKREKYINRK